MYKYTWLSKVEHKHSGEKNTTKKKTTNSYEAHIVCQHGVCDEMALLKRTIAEAGTERNGTPSSHHLKANWKSFQSGPLKPPTENFKWFHTLSIRNQRRKFCFLWYNLHRHIQQQQKPLNARNIRTFITVFFWKMIVNLIRMSQNFLFVYYSHKKKCYWTVSKIKLIPGVRMGVGGE